MTSLPTAAMHAQATQAAQTANPRDAHIAAVVTYTAATTRPALTMDYYKPAGAGPHPAVIIIHGGGFTSGTSRNGSEAYCADFLAPSGYAVFSINYRLSPPANFADMLADVERSVRFVRHNAAQYDVDPNKIALLGGSAGGYLSNMEGLTRPSALVAATDPVDRETDAVQAVVTLYGISDWATMPDTSLLGKYPLLGSQPVTPANLTAASPLSHVTRRAPPFLLIHGDKDASVPIAQSLKLQSALQQAGATADLITIPNAPHATGSWHTLPGVPDWEKQMTEWLNRTLDHTGPVGEGIIARAPAAK